MNLDKEKAQKAVRDLLIALGENPDRDGLADTPKRVVAFYQDMLLGFYKKEEDLNFFKEDFCGDMVLVRDIEFYSLCEHHLLPFYGVAHVCYVPTGGKLLGISQLARIVDLFASRLQLQENMTKQIADLLEQKAQAAGVAIAIQATHMCMTMRGAKKPAAKVITTTFRGSFKTDPQKREEFMRLIN